MANGIPLVLLSEGGSGGSGPPGPPGPPVAFYVGITSGTNTYTATPSPALSGYVSGDLYSARFSVANTGAATLDVNGLGAVPIQLNGIAVTAGQIPLNSTLALLYDGINFQIVGESGGGAFGLLYWVEALSTTAPNDLVNAVSFSATGGATTDADAIIAPRGAGALLAQIPDGTTAGGNKRGKGAVDFQLVRSVVTQVAAGDFSCIIAGRRNTVTGIASAALSGDDNVCSTDHGLVTGRQNTVGAVGSAILGGRYNNVEYNSVYSAIIGGLNNTVHGTADNAVIIAGVINSVSGSRTAVVGGDRNSASASHASVFCSSNSIASGTYATVLGGRYGTASGSKSVTISSNGATADADFSMAVGNRAHARGRINAAVRAVASGTFSEGDSNGRTPQNGDFILCTATSDATPKLLDTSNTASTSSTKQMSLLEQNTVMTFTAIVTAMKYGGGDCAHWKFEGGMHNFSGTTALTAAVTPTLIAATAGASTWSIAVTADSTNSSLNVTVTGQAGTEIRWACRLFNIEIS